MRTRSPGALLALSLALPAQATPTPAPTPETRSAHPSLSAPHAATPSPIVASRSTFAASPTKPKTATRVELTSSSTLLYAADNRDFAENQVATLINDDWGVFYNRLHASAEHGAFRFGLRLDNAFYFASPDPTETALELVERRPDGASTPSDPVYFRSKVYEAGRELSNRYINWVYPAKYWVGYSTRDLELTLGDVVAELGHGLVLSVRKRDELSSDDSVRGLRATGRLRLGDARLSLTALGGSLNPLRIDEGSGRYLGVHSSVTPGFVALTEAGMPRAIVTDFAADTGDCRTTPTCSYAPDRLAAAQVLLGLHKTELGTQGSLLVRDDALSPDLVRSAERVLTVSQSLKTSFAGGAFNVDLEAAGQSLSHRGDRQQPELDPGYAVYASTTLVDDPWLVLVEAKHYRRFFPLYANVSVARAREFSLAAWSAPPTGEAEYIDTEHESFNTCVSGARARVDRRLNRSLSTFGWLGYWETFAETVSNENCDTGSENKNRVFDLATGVEVSSRAETRGSLTIGSRFDDANSELSAPGGATHVFYRELYARYHVVSALGGPFALDLSGWHRRRRRTLGGPLEPWFEGEHTTGVDIGAEWSVAAGFEYDTNPQQPPTYLNLTARYRPTPSSSIALFAGQRRGALRCIGGVCRLVPGFEGARLDATVRF